MSKYASLHDPNVLNDKEAFMSAKVVAKFCNLGIVTSAKWFPCYITMYDNVLRLYDEENTVLHNPANTVLEIPLDRTIHSSPWNRKNYSKIPGTPIDFFTFYLTQDAIFGQQQRLLKIGCTDFQVLKNTKITLVKFSS